MNQSRSTYYLKILTVMKRNVKEIVINVPTELHLNKINSTFALKKLFREPLKVGDNTLIVNHFNYSEIVRLQWLFVVLVFIFFCGQILRLFAPN